MQEVGAARRRLAGTHRAAVLRRPLRGRGDRPAERRSTGPPPSAASAPTTAAGRPSWPPCSFPDQNDGWRQRLGAGDVDLVETSRAPPCAPGVPGMSRPVPFVLGTGRCGSTPGPRGAGPPPGRRVRDQPRRPLARPVAAAPGNNAIYRRVPADWRQKGGARFAPSEGYRVAGPRGRPGARATRCATWRRPTRRRGCASGSGLLHGPGRAPRAGPLFLHKFTGWPRCRLRARPPSRTRLRAPGPRRPRRRELVAADAVVAGPPRSRGLALRSPAARPTRRSGRRRAGRTSCWPRLAWKLLLDAFDDAARQAAARPAPRRAVRGPARRPRRHPRPARPVRGAGAVGSASTGRSPPRA